MKVIIFGGSGFRSTNRENFSPTPTSSHQCFTSWKACHALRILEPPSAVGISDVTRDTNWQEQVQRADWVIDTVGILFENPRKNLSTANSDASEKISSFSTTKSQLSFIYFSQYCSFPFEKIYGCQISSGGTNPPRSRRSSDFYPSLLVGQERTGTILLVNVFIFKKIPF